MTQPIADPLPGQSKTEFNILAEFIRNCKKRKKTSKLADSLGNEATGGELLTKTLVLKQLLETKILQADEKYIGVLLPPSVAGCMVNVAIAMVGKVSVNLNYTSSEEILNYCIKSGEIQHVLTSRKFMQKLDLSLNAEVIYLEDLKPLVTLGMKLSAYWNSTFVPAERLITKLGLEHQDNNEELTLVFTSGSTGNPKGVLLTYGNIASNIDAFAKAVLIQSTDSITGVLPFFHSFGYTVTLWGVMSLDIRGAYHYNPLEAKQVGKLCQKHKTTILLATPTFLRSYIKRCNVEQFQNLNLVVVGAEKLPDDMTEKFKEKFGFAPVEGYGVTELSPVVSVNVPTSRNADPNVGGVKVGSVGRPLNGIAAKIVHPETNEDLPQGESGMLLIRGPNVMKGYLKQPEKTAEVLKQGWYTTGDIAYLDEDNFIFITGRQSRFSKISGEMVPHVKVEEAINQILHSDEHEMLLAAVTAVPDEKKGEQLVVLHLPLEKKIADILVSLKEKGMPNLFLPAEHYFFEVEDLPLLGSGKLDLKTVKKIALEKAGKA
ncbi:MAG: AMP-binding protein [Pirellulaceae bacterium]|nr:AMP-binding protein [Pirellulaceae bacterium]